MHGDDAKSFTISCVLDGIDSGDPNNQQKVTIDLFSIYCCYNVNTSSYIVPNFSTRRNYQCYEISQLCQHCLQSI